MQTNILRIFKKTKKKKSYSAFRLARVRYLFIYICAQYLCLDWLVYSHATLYALFQGVLVSKVPSMGPIPLILSPPPQKKKKKKYQS